MANFSDISTHYAKDAAVQKSASETLFTLLDIQANEAVLDLGCGPGHLSLLISEATSGRVVGVDPSEGMISKARESYKGEKLSFIQERAEKMQFNNEFDVIFCNSAFQWFSHPQQALTACHKALRTGGRMAMQAPATNTYCPNFLQAIDEVANHEATREDFATFTSPWFFKETAGEYAALFEGAGFIVKKAYIEKVVQHHSAEKTFQIFESGAAAGYLNPDYYSVPLPGSFAADFKKIIRASFEKQETASGGVELVFYRIYLFAEKVL